MVTRQHLDDGFRLLGVRSGDSVEVHSSLSSFGRVVGGAATVVDSLMHIVGPSGAIVMPVHPLLSPSLPVSAEERARGIKYKCTVLPPEDAPTTGMGAIVDEFLTRDGVILGPGMHRVCAWGRDADRHSQGFSHLVETGGRALLIGVGIHKLSSMHNPEYSVGIPDEIRALSALPRDIAEDYPKDQWYVECEQVKGLPGDAWGTVWQEAVAAGHVSTRTIGKADCHLFRASDVVGIYEKHLRTDPWTLFGVSRPAD